MSLSRCVYDMLVCLMYFSLSLTNAVQSLSCSTYHLMLDCMDLMYLAYK